jgi:pyrroline-5-carboxylate reductase
MTEVRAVAEKSELPVGFVGSGEIAGAVARGWGQPILCTDNGSGRAAALATELGGRQLRTNRELVGSASVVVLAHPADRLAQVADEIADVVDGVTVVSLLGNVGVDELRTALPGAHVVRAIPIPAVEARVGVTVLAAPPDLPPHVLAETRARFDWLGTTIVLPDARIEAASVIGSMFPAYVALVVEAQIDAGLRVGLGEQEAAELVQANLRAAANHLEVLDGDTVRLRRSHSTPGGRTVRGLEALERSGLRAAFLAAAVAAIGEPPAGSS